METYSANEVVAQVEGLNTVKTLNRWRKIVEGGFGMNYFKPYCIDNTLSSIRYSFDDVKRFQLTASILMNQPGNRKNLQKAILTAFSPDEPPIRKKTDIEALEDKLASGMTYLANENKRMRTAIELINVKLAIIEKQAQAEKDSKSKFFRRK